MKRSVRWAIGTVLAIGVLAAMASPALAQDGDRARLRDSVVSVTGNVTIDAEDVVDGAVVSIDGDVAVLGRVDGDVYVAHGDVVVEEAATVDGTIVVADGDVIVFGTVGDDITVIDGRARVPSGTVRGDVRSSERPLIGPDARVTGEVDEIDVTGWFTAIGFALLAYLWIAISVSLFVVGIVLFAVFPRAGDTIVRTAHDAPGPCIAWGAIIAFGLPIAAGIAISTLVGLPLGLGALLAMGLVFCLGYVASAAALGRLIVKEKSGLVAFLAGFGILRAIALVPGIGLLAWVLASAYGVGVLAVASYRSGRGPTAPRTEAAPPGEPVEPVEPAGTTEPVTVAPTGAVTTPPPAAAPPPESPPPASTTPSADLDE